MTAAAAPLNLALQGGGAHGAFTWGVLDYLLSQADLPIAGISGTSAGAMNAAVLVAGWERGLAQYEQEQQRRSKRQSNKAEATKLERELAAREGARKALKSFWQDISAGGAGLAPMLWPQIAWQEGTAQLTRLLPAPIASMFAAMRQSPMMLAQFNLDANIAFKAFETLSQFFSPYELNPLDLNPLRLILEKHVEPELLRHSKLGLFITATAVRTGQPRVFANDDLSIDALLASAALPLLFRAVEIDGEAYWDGGYVGNPALWPLTYRTEASDLLLVRLNPLVREELPVRAGDILNRLNEITFNASLVAEMRAIAFVKRLVQEERVPAERYRNLRIHMIDADERLKPLNASSKFNSQWSFFAQLHELGFEAAQQWLEKHRADLGVRDTVDIEKTFLSGR